MLPLIRKALRSNIMLKVAAGIIGYSVWAIMSQSYTQDSWYTVPVCVHSLPDTLNIDAPDTIEIHLAGRKSDIYHLDAEQLALHIDGQTLRPGENCIAITGATLFLPETIKLLHYTPHQVTITVTHAVAHNTQPTIVT